MATFVSLASRQPKTRLPAPCRHEWAAPEGATGAVLGQHREPARCVLWLPQQGLVASAGWDARLCIWRTAPLPVAVEDQENQAAAAQAPLAELALPGKAYSMSLSGSRLIIATSERHLLVVNLEGCVRGVRGCLRRLLFSHLQGRVKCVHYIFGTQTLPRNHASGMQSHPSVQV